jgi:hypothetical protein
MQIGIKEMVANNSTKVFDYLIINSLNKLQMKKLILAIIMMCCFVGISNAQSVVREGNTFTSIKSSTKDTVENKTQFTWKDSKGKLYPIYVSKSGSCYIKRISKKTNKEYKQYLGKEISAQICKELGIKYTPKKK